MSLTIQGVSLADIDHLDQLLLNQFRDKFLVQPALTRPLVSFQANKNRPVYRWYKYKEAFSAALVEYLLEKYHVAAGRLLDPFAGSGTALFAASVMGLDADGIELLPIGQQIIETKRLLDTEFTEQDLDVLRKWASLRGWEQVAPTITLHELSLWAKTGAEAF